MQTAIKALLFFLCVLWKIPGWLLAFMAPLPAVHKAGPDRMDVLCLSHVAWKEHIWQRNHHVMSRLARKGTVLYCYPVKFGAILRFWKRILTGDWQAPEGVYVHYLLLIPGSRRIAWVESLNTRLATAELRRLAARCGMDDFILWYYFPDAVYLAGQLGEKAVVYDIQDNYAGFAWASPDVVRRENQLLSRADQVFTGTHALLEQHREKARRIEFIPCGVDFAFFQEARTGRQKPPEPLGNLSRPVFGYFGLIGSRIDLPLIEELARRQPGWTFLMLGPVERDAPKIDALPNIVFTGRVDYAELPGYAALFDVCLMPFVLNDLTRSINPTKTLEYFALERPVVSSAIPDMLKFYRDVIAFADSPDAWETCLKEALEPDPERIARALEIARENSWQAVTDRFVEAIQAL